MGESRLKLFYNYKFYSIKLWLQRRNIGVTTKAGVTMAIQLTEEP